MDIDDRDLSILRLLQENARMSNAEIARRIGLVTSSVFQRVRRLEENGILQRYDCLLDARTLDLGLVAYIMVQTGDVHAEHGTGAALCALPNVLEVHRVIGESCFLVKARVQDTDALASLLDEDIARIPSVASTHTRIVVRTMKETLLLPLPAPAPDAGVPDPS